jgi:RecA-family ATPase
LAGQDAVMGAPEGKAALIAPTAVFRSLVALVERIKPCLVVLDALADVYGGEENARAEARQFIGLLRGLAIRNDLAVVLIAHPSLSGMASGSGTSGSTAWSNSVRARLYLERIVDESNREIDPDLRVLPVKKSNYGPVGLEMRLRWQNGAFILHDNPGGFDKLAADAKAERVFLDLLAAFESQGRDVSPKPSQTYAPSVFEKHPNAEGITKRGFAAAMERLLSAGRILVETVGPPSRQYKRLTLAPEIDRP